MFEVWVSENRVCAGSPHTTYGDMRFNARFGTGERAALERAWYLERGYWCLILISPLFR